MVAFLKASDTLTHRLDSAREGSAQDIRIRNRVSAEFLYLPFNGCEGDTIDLDEEFVGTRSVGVSWANRYCLSGSWNPRSLVGHICTAGDFECELRYDLKT